MDDLEARVENTIGRTLAAHNRHVPLSVRHAVALAVVATVHGEDEDRGTGCCARDGVNCPSCMTGRCYECRECVHYDDSARDEDEGDDDD